MLRDVKGSWTTCLDKVVATVRNAGAPDGEGAVVEALDKGEHKPGLTSRFFRERTQVEAGTWHPVMKGFFGRLRPWTKEGQLLEVRPITRNSKRLHLDELLPFEDSVGLCPKEFELNIAVR